MVFTHPASFLTYGVLRLPKHTIRARYTHVFFTFLISGLLHVGAEIGGERPLQDSGTLRFFITQVLGIMIEDTVQATFRSARLKSEGRRRPLWLRPLGYVWVVAFLYWSTPAWLYPDAAGPPKISFLPFTIVGEHV